MKSLHFKYYMFDWDDNILHMPTRIHLERKTARGWKPYDVSTSAFARIRRDTVNYRARGNDWDKAFVDFYDIGHRGSRAFLDDTRKALAPVIRGTKRGAPSFLKFKKALMEGRLFAIITARSHGSASIRKGVEYFIEKVLKLDEKAKMIRSLRHYVSYFGGDPEHLSDAQILENYLDLNHYRGVTSPEFQKLMGRRFGGSESPEHAKQVAIHEFVKHIIQLMKHRRGHESISVGFSDDDPHNVRAIEGYLRKELARQFKGIKFVVYDTSDRRKRGGRKIVVQEK